MKRSGWLGTKTGDDHSRLALLLLQGALIGAVVVTLLPYVWMVSSSFKPGGDIISSTVQLIPRHPILDNYVTALTRTPTLQAILNSLIMAGGETIAVVVTSIITAFIRWPA